MVIDFESKVLKVPEKLATICNANTAMVYAVLLASSDDNGITQISKNEIAYRAGIASKSVQRIIRKLEDMSIVECQYNIGYATTYHVMNILPAEQPEVRAAAPEEGPAEPTEPARQSEQRPELKPGYQYYGEYQMIPLLPEEYKKLGDKYGRKKVDKYIAKMEIWMMKKNSNRYDNYFGALADWMMTDAQRLEHAQKSRQKYRPTLEGEEDPNWRDAYVDEWDKQEAKLRGKEKERQEELDKYLDLIN